MSDHWLPLELRLEEFASNRKGEFADQHVKYWDRYTSLVHSLQTYVYRYINAGLSSLSRSPGFFTDHGELHFDEVVRYAGYLIEGTFDQKDASLNPYELYLLLCAIRVHDAGNIDGRDNHARKAFPILKEYGGDIAKDSAEHRLIADIAQAHGGRTVSDNDKDTIGALLDTTLVGGADARPRLVAAIVRFADEICEHRSRASLHHVNQGNLPPESELFHHYAKCIVGAKPDRLNKSFKLQFDFDVDLLSKKYKIPQDENGNTEKYLIDDVMDRLDKLNHERVYCNRFLLHSMQTDRIEVSMYFTKIKSADGIDQNIALERKSFTIKDKGYPELPADWRKEDDVAAITGIDMAKKEWGK
ncbi:MAG: hypothetical protein HZB71_01205 [Betaproteobacteria bacterium]|nr:hypothetical protein [Betaproteobacteria bacterium]